MPSTSTVIKTRHLLRLDLALNSLRIFLSVALQDHLKRLSPSSSSSSSSGPSSSNAPSKPAEPKKDYSLKAGQTFTISVPGASKTGAAKPKKVESAGGATPFILPPPPSGRKRE